MRHYVRNRYGRLNIKLRRAIFQLGAAGMGIYTYLREEMEENGGWLYMDDVKMFARELKTTAKKVTQIITDFELFAVNDEEGIFECVELPNVEGEGCEDGEKETVTKKEIAPELSEKRRKAIQKRWAKNTNLYEADTNGDTKPDTNLYSENTNGDTNLYEADTNGDTNLYHSKSEQETVENAEICAKSEAPRARTIVINNNINNNISTTTKQLSYAMAADAADVDDEAERLDVEEAAADVLPSKKKKQRAGTESRAAAISTPQPAAESEENTQDSPKCDFKGANGGVNGEEGKLPAPDEENANKGQITPFNQNGLMTEGRTPDQVRNDILLGMGHDYVLRMLLARCPPLTQGEILSLIPDFIAQLQVDGKTDETGRCLYNHFGNWLGKKAQYILNQRNNGTPREQADARRRQSQQNSEDIMLGRKPLFAFMPSDGGCDADNPPF